MFAIVGDGNITNKRRREQKVREILYNNLKVKRRRSAICSKQKIVTNREEKRNIMRIVKVK